MEVNTTYYNYDYYDNYTDGHVFPVSPCSRDGDNNLGAGLSVLYYFMFAFSVLGNSLVLVIIHRYEKLTTVTNILLLNLVLSSLIFMSSLPFVSVYMQLSDWIFGKVMCKLVGSVYYLGFYSSVLFLTLLTFDRHLAVVYSLGATQVRSRRYAVISCGVVWLVSGLACVRPMLLQTAYYYEIDQRTYCDEYVADDLQLNVAHLRASGFYLQLFLFLIFPLAVIVYCYVRIAVTVMSSRLTAKFKTMRLIFVIVVLFFLCWTPFNVVMLIHERDEPMSCEEGQRLGYALQVARPLTYLYFCVSPIFYTFVGKKFQNHFRQLVAKRFPSLKKQITASHDSGTNMSTKVTPIEL